MFFGAAETTAYDLKFRLLDIPVRVHPWFWIATVLLNGDPLLKLGPPATVGDD